MFANIEARNIKKFVNKYFTYEILTDNNYVKQNKVDNNMYNFDYSSVSEEDIIKGCIKSNIAVFLHGASGDGKSSRVKELDPDLEIVYLRNASPDSLNGKSVYNPSTGQMLDIEPTWYKNLVKKCVSEPDKLHILFFDELTNALPSIQGMAFNIILDKEVNGKFRLPDNARIVAAGNDLDDSLAANKLAEPLFNRFAHVYIKTNINNWLNWAITTNNSYERLDYESINIKFKIHPSIYSYVASNSNVLRTPFNGKTPNADPRKWEMASHLLYTTNKPEMLRALIGEELTADFIEYSKMVVLTVQDVLNKNYDLVHIKAMNMSEKYATAVSLSNVNDKYFKVIDKFMMLLGKEAKALFESLWSLNNEKRLEIIQEIRLIEKEEQTKKYKKIINTIANSSTPYRGDN